MFRFTQTPLVGLVLIEPEVHNDVRGRFFETYSAREFEQNGIGESFVQCNHSTSTLGVLRGLHFQREHPQAKLVRAAYGAVYDVAVDLRKNSESFGCYFGTVLSGENRRMLYIPIGFAHGFVTLTEYAEFVYHCSDYYYSGCDGGIRFDDPQINIRWPIHPRLLSEKDAALPCLQEVEACGCL